MTISQRLRSLVHLALLHDIASTEQLRHVYLRQRTLMESRLEDRRAAE